MKITIGQLVIVIDERRLGPDVLVLVTVRCQTRRLATRPGEHDLPDRPGTRLSR